MKRFFHKIRIWIATHPQLLACICVGLVLLLPIVLIVGIAISNIESLTYDYTGMTDQIAQVEIVNISYSQTNELNMDVVQTFEKEEMLPLLQDLSQIEYNHYVLGDPKFYLAEGKGLRIVFKDGSTDILTYWVTESKGATHHPHFESDNDFKNDFRCHCDYELFQQLIDKYLD